MVSFSFAVPGECRGKMRPKASAFGGHTKVYTPKEQVEYENWVRLCFCEKYPDAKPFERDVPLSVSIIINKAIPTSFSKKKIALALSGDIRPTTKVDVDNGAKSILDALNEIAYKDDAQIVELTVSKNYATEASTFVVIGQYGEKTE